MGTRIIVNGHEYDSADNMPPEVQQVYQQALAHLAEADGNGIPDIREGGTAGNVVGVQHSSITVNGRTYGNAGEMPAPVRWLYEQAMARVAGNGNGGLAAMSGLQMLSHGADPVSPDLAWPEDALTISHPHDREHGMTVLGRVDRALTVFLRILLGLIVIATIAGAFFIMLIMDAASRSQGGRFYVVVMALVLLGAVDSQFKRLARRQSGFTDTMEYARYRRHSLLLLLISTVALVGFALLVP